MLFSPFQAPALKRNLFLNYPIRFLLFCANQDIYCHIWKIGEIVAIGLHPQAVNQSSQNSHQRMPSPRPMWRCDSNPLQPNTFDIFALYGRVALIGKFTFWEITFTASLGGVA